MKLKLIPDTIFPRFSQKKDESGLEYATFTGRIFAMSLDLILLMTVFGPAFFWLSSQFYSVEEQQRLIGQAQGAIQAALARSITPQQTLAELWQIGLFHKLMFDYSTQIAITGVIVVLFWQRFAATPAMLLLRMRIADAETRDKPTLEQFVLRYLGTVLALLPLMLGMVWIIFDRRNQAWQDKIARTVVMREPIAWRGLFAKLRGKANTPSTAANEEETAVPPEPEKETPKS